MVHKKEEDLPEEVQEASRKFAENAIKLALWAEAQGHNIKDSPVINEIKLGAFVENAEEIDSDISKEETVLRLTIQQIEEFS